MNDLRNDLFDCRAFGDGLIANQAIGLCLENVVSFPWDGIGIGIGQMTNQAIWLLSCAIGAPTIQASAWLRVTVRNSSGWTIPLKCMKPARSEWFMHSVPTSINWKLEHSRVLVNGGRVEYVADEGKRSLNCTR